MKKLSFYYFSFFINLIIILYLFCMSIISPTISYEGNEGLIGFLQAHNLTFLFIICIILILYFFYKILCNIYFEIKKTKNQN